MSQDMQVRDYLDSGLTIQDAMLDHFKRFPDKRQRPGHILWGELEVRTSDCLTVPAHGVVQGEILSSKGDVRQGFDLKIDGWLWLANRDKVSLLRTWDDPQYDPVVEYPYHSKDGKLWIWNVFIRSLPNGQQVEEKWTENAGMWVDEVSKNKRIYHCSHGLLYPPDFESLVFKIEIRNE